MSDATKPPAHLLFGVADARWALDVRSVHKVHEQLSVQIVPGTQVWFLGLAAVDGQLVPVTDLGAWLSQSPSTGPVIHLTPGFGSCGLRVDEIFGTQNLSIVDAALGASHTLMPGALPQVIEHDGADYRLIQMSSLVESPAFVAIREAISV